MDYKKDGVIGKLLFARRDDETYAYISVWDPFCGSFVLAHVTSAINHTQVYVRTCVRTYVTNGNIWYVGCYICGIIHQVVSRWVSLGNPLCGMIIQYLFGTEGNCCQQQGNCCQQQLPSVGAF